MHYPHIIPFNLACDICFSTTKVSVDLITPYVGYTCCTNKICKDTINESKKHCVMTKEQLINEIGTSSIRVKRSSKKIESGWEIVSDGYKLKTDNTKTLILVQRKNPHRKCKKIITYSELKKLNSRNDLSY